MRRPAENVLFQRLPRIGRLVAARDPERVVELKATLAAALQIDAAVFARKFEIAVLRRTRGGLGINRLAKFLLCLAARDHHLPWLAVAPRCGALRGREH